LHTAPDYQDAQFYLICFLVLFPKEGWHLFIIASDTHAKTIDLEKNVGLVIALRPQTPKHIRGGWSHYTDTSE
jgi:hypothetical protein